VTSDWAPLRAVMLAWPGAELEFREDPDAWLMLARPRLDAMRRECEGIARFYEDQGVAVHLARPGALPPPNFIFQRDLYQATADGMILARTGAEQRAGEERFAAQALAGIGAPILATMTGTAIFEGADLVTVDRHTALLGLGRRTNAEAALRLTRILGRQGRRVRRVRLPAGVQHLLGIVNLVDRDLAAVHVAKAPPALRRLLAELGVRTVDLAPTEELTVRRGMNFVTLAPRVVVMPAGCPGIRAQLERARVTVFELAVDEYLKAAGGLGCLTGILHRA